MAELRKPFQGVGNIVRFNRHFYLFSAVVVTVLLTASLFLRAPFNFLLIGGCLATILVTVISLVVSFYVYDCSGIYDLNWIESKTPRGAIVNINAGFDEISKTLKKRFPDAQLIVCDFYDAARHTEISIERARKTYPPFPETQSISTTKIPFENNSIETIFLFFAAHEIRLESEKTEFFHELNRCLMSRGEIYVVEHLRDGANFFAYNIGFLHFFSKASWRRVFTEANFKIAKETKLTPFVSLFTLSKNGNSS